MGTLVLKNPQNMLCSFAITLIDNVINVYQAVVSSRNSPRMVKNLHWLRRLRGRLDVRMAQTPEEQNGNTGDSTHGDGNDHEELLGWRTRLISSAGRGLQVSSTIHPNHASSAVNYESMSHPSSLAAAAAEGNVWDSEVSPVIPFRVALSLVNHRHTERQ
jgi:hypothetical protein